MSFLSFEWLTWLIGTVSLYWLFPAWVRDYVLIAITAAFLAIHAPLSLVILIGFSVFTYYGTQVAEVSGRRVVIVSGIVVTILAFFKISVYVDHGAVGDTLIPLGLSYYSFRCFHYVFERYRCTVEKLAFADFLSYMFFLPTLVIGPINRIKPFLADLNGKTWSPSMLSYGMERILYGYAKITILSGFLVNGVLRDWQSGVDPATDAVLHTYIGIMIDGLDLYFLFAGYSDIAIGFARLLGYKIMENFNWPFFQKNISDFWRCWHISLSNWCRDYVYFPVVGHTRNPYLGTLATFVVIGLWHELSTRYILWGLWHGVGIVVWRKFTDLRRRRQWPTAQNQALRAILDGLSILLTVNYVWFGLVIVSRGSLIESLQVYRTVLLFWLP